MRVAGKLSPAWDSATAGCSPIGGRRSVFAVRWGSLWWLAGVGVDRWLARWGNPPRRSEAEARHARQQQREDRLIRGRLWQVQANLRPQHLDAYRELDETQPQRVKLRDPPVRAARHQRAQAPHQPIGADMQKQAHLIGGRAAT